MTVHLPIPTVRRFYLAPETNKIYCTDMEKTIKCPEDLTTYFGFYGCRNFVWGIFDNDGELTSWHLSVERALFIADGRKVEKIYKSLEDRK